MKVRLFINSELASGDVQDLRKDHVNYVSNVLRLRDGDEIFVFNPKYGEFKAVLRNRDKIEIFENVQKPEAEDKLSLIFAPIKFGKIDYLVQKATELGVTELLPVSTRYTIVSRINYDRMSANAIEAAEQCGRITLPLVKEMVSLEKLISKWDGKQKIIFCDESGKGKPFAEAVGSLPKATKDVAILIGPEGGFTADEAEMLRKQKFVISASLGKRLLRAETAALAALAAYQAVRGDWS